MDEFEFDDGGKVRTSVSSSVAGASAQSFSQTSSSAGSSIPRRKRHRLNYGSSKLPCRNEGGFNGNHNSGKTDESPLSDCKVSSTKEKGHTLCPIDEEDSYVAPATPPKTSRTARPSRRRRKNTIPKIHNNPQKPYEIFATRSPHSFSSPSSFLSSLQSSESSVGIVEPAVKPLQVSHKDGGLEGLYSGKTEDEAKAEKCYNDMSGSPPPPLANRLSEPTIKIDENPDSSLRLNNNHERIISSTNDEGEDNASISPSHQEDCRLHAANSNESKPIRDTKYLKRSKSRRPKRKSLRDENVFDDDYDNDDDEEGYHECSQSSFGNSSIASFSPAPTEKIVTRARTNVFVAQDAGSCRLILDDCNYFCSSFLSGIGEVSDSSTQRQYGEVAADAACDLAIMLSSTQNRRVLTSLARVDCTVNMESQGSEASNEQCVFESMMEVLSCAPDPLDPFDMSSLSSLSEQDQVAFIHGNKYDEMHQRTDVSNDVTSTQRSSSNARRTKTSRKQIESKRTSNSVSTCYDKIVSNALAMIAHFLSLDCSTNEQDSAMTSALEAKEFRCRILRDKGVLCGITRLVLMDSIVLSILNKGVSGKKIEGDPRQPIPLDHADNIDVQANAITTKVHTDPTHLGRRKRRRKNHSTEASATDKGEQNPECTRSKDEKNFGHKNDFDFSSVGTPQSIRSANTVSLRSNGVEEVPSRFIKKISKAGSKVLLPHLDLTHNQTVSVATSKDSPDDHYSDNCQRHQKGNINPGHLALGALNRILNQKLNEEVDGDHDEDFQNEHLSNEFENEISQFFDEESDMSDVEKNNLNNPIMFKNFMYRRSGSIPLLVRAMAESLHAAVLVGVDANCSTSQEHGRNSKIDLCCDEYMQYLRDRILCLSSIIDGISCMSRKNRNVICRTSSTSKNQHQPLLIPILLKSISDLSVAKTGKYEHLMRDIGLAGLRTLTSLTHENDVAGLQMSLRYISEGKSSLDDHSSGSEYVIRLLYHFVQRKQSSEEKSPHTYDAIIFCLNILTNTLESSSASEIRNTILKMRLPKNHNEDTQLALVWLSQWIVRQTEPFQNVLLSDNFCNKDETEASKNCVVRDLEEHEDEYLITAGNGFILLTYLLRKVEDHGVTSKKPSLQQVRDLILSQIPENKKGDKLILAINTLKAFCNFYRFSIGDLSVAVVAPVLKLIAELEDMQCSWKSSPIK